MSKEYSRRDVLKMAGVGIAGITLGRCSSRPEATPVPTEEPVMAESTTTPTVTEKGTVAPTPTATETAMPTKEKVGFSLQGIPEKIDSEQVLIAKEEFKNEIGQGTESWLAEPGVLLVGPDFDPNEIEKANNCIEYINPINQQVFETPTAFFNIPEGGFMLVTGAKMTMEANDSIIELKDQKDHNWILVVRGLFADGKQDSDRNVTACFRHYYPGHIQATKYPQGAFISEKHFQQIVQTSHSGGSNCGAEGCSGLSVAFLDLNTKAFTIIHQEQAGGEWEQIYSNWENQ